MNHVTAIGSPNSPVRFFQTHPEVALALLAEVRRWRDAWGSSIELKVTGSWGFATDQDRADFQPVRDAMAHTDAALARCETDMDRLAKESEQ